MALCTWQGARHLPEQLASLAAQTRLPDEMVVVDDCSDDGSVELVRRFARDAPFPVHLTIREERGGAVAAFGDALARCTGDLMAFCDQDDRWHPDKLARLEDEFRTHPGVTAVFSDGDLIDDTGAPRPGSLWDGVGFSGRVRQRFRTDPLATLLGRSVVTGCAAVFRRDAVDAALPFPPELHDPRRPILHDRWLALVSACLGEVRAHPGRLVAYRVHAAQATGVRASGLRARLPVVRADASRSTGTVAGAASAAAAQVEALAQRMPDLAPPAAAAIAQAGAELRARAELPAARARRAGAVWRLLRSGAYTRHASGWRSAAADLLRPAAEASPRLDL